MREFQGSVKGSGLRIAVVASRFHESVCDNLVAGALAELKRLGLGSSQITVVRVPGAFEIPMAMEALAAADPHHAFVALGCVIRGETPHFDYICREVSHACMAMSRDRRIPVGFGFLTCETMEQAEARSDMEATGSSEQAKNSGGRSNKGIEAARAAVEMANLFRMW